MMWRYSIVLALGLTALAQVPSKSGLKLGDLSVHDPFILAHAQSRTYYLYNSSGPRQTGRPRSGVLVYKSTDLENWEGPKVIFEVPDGLWANPAHGVWAPEVHEYRGKFYLLATLHNNDKLIDMPAEELLPGLPGQEGPPPPARHADLRRGRPRKGRSSPWATPRRRRWTI